MKSEARQFELWIVLKCLLKYIRQYPKLLYASILFSIALALVSPLRPYLVDLTINFFSHNDGYLPKTIIRFFLFIKVQSHQQIIIGLILCQFFIIISEFLCKFLFMYFSNYLGQKVIFEVRQLVFKKIIHFPTSQFDNTPIGIFITRTVNDLVTMEEIFNDGILSIISDILNILVVMGFMLSLNWKLSLITWIGIALYLYCTYIFKKAVSKNYSLVRQAIVKLNSFIQESLNGIFILQSFNVEAKFFNQFKNLNRDYRVANIKNIFAYALFIPLTDIILSFSIALAVWYVVSFKFQIGLLTAFILCINMIFRPLRFIADKFNTLQMGLIASQKVFEIIEDDDSIILHPPSIIGQGKKFINGDIEFKNLWMSYKKDSWILKNINLKISKGDTVAIIGKTGSGKTSLVNALTRLYPFDSGQLLINNIPINEINKKELHQNIALVSQDIFLFSGSLLENIRLYNQNIGLSEIRSLAQEFEFDDIFLSLPNGYNFEVQEKGATLSLGQKQIISFMRTLILNPKILVLDEATSSIDPKTEELIQKAMRNIINNRTTLIIAHRLSTIEITNKTVVIKNGEISNYGNTAEIMKGL